MRNARKIFLVCLLAIVFYPCVTLANDDVYVINKSFLKKMDSSPSLEGFLNNYFELLYLINVDDELAFQVGFKVLVKQCYPQCYATDRMVGVMYERLAETLSWGDEQFWNKLEIQDIKTISKVIYIYKNQFQKYRTPDFDTYKQEMIDKLIAKKRINNKADLEIEKGKEK